MKLFATVSFLFTLILITGFAQAQISYYGVDANVNDQGRTKVKLTINFASAESGFDFNVLGRVENFNATSIAGPIVCDVQVRGISTVSCSVNLTLEKRTVEISYETDDFVVSLGDRFRFSGDFSLNKDINQLFVSVKLPEGGELVKEDISGKLSFPQFASTLNNGNLITWTITNVRKDQPLQFDILYDVTPPWWMQFRLRYVAVFGVAFAVALGFIIIRYYRKTEKLVLSVLDDFERKIVEVISSEGGIINQRKVVQLTNLSKAKVSRVVKSLQERGLIEVQRLGRTNKLKLLKKKLQA